MSGFKEKTWMKWKESKTTSPVSVTEKKTTDSITSQRSSSLIRSRKRHTTREGADNISAAEYRGIIIPRTPVKNGRNKRAAANNKNHSDTEQKNDFKNTTTSPFNTLASKNPFYQKNAIIVQYGELEEYNSDSDVQEPTELWGEPRAPEVQAESPQPVKNKDPNGESKHPATAPSESHSPPPHSGQSQNPRTSPSSDPGDEICDIPDCPARGPKQKERLCMAPECPVTMKKAVVKEAKKAMKRSSGKKRKNPLTILGAALMSTFAGRDSPCKLTKEEKRALKRMKDTEEDHDDNYNGTVKAKRSKGVQCKVPMSQKTKADKSTACDIPECPIAMQKTQIKEFMDKGQLCDLPSCPVKDQPPPRKEKKVEVPKGCPSKPCTLKTKDEEFLKQLDPSIFEKLPRLKMTCDEALAEDNGGQSRPHHILHGKKHKDKPSTKKTREQDKGGKIIAGHVRLSPPSENPFLKTIPNPQEFRSSNKLTGENQLNSDRASECQKLVDRRLSCTPTLVSKAESDVLEYTRPRPFRLSLKNTSAIKTEAGISSRQPKIRFSNVSVNRKDDSSLRLQNAPEINETIESPQEPSTKSTRSVQMRYGESLESKIKLNHPVDAISKSKLIASKTLLISENGLKSGKQSSFISTSAEDPIKNYAALEDEAAKESIVFNSVAKIDKSKEIEIRSPQVLFADDRVGIAKVEGIMQDTPAFRTSYSLIGESDLKTRESGSLKVDFSPVLEDKLWSEDTDPGNLRSIVPVNHSTGYDVVSNRILEGPFDLPTPTETPAIQLSKENWNTAENSATSLTETTTANPPKKIESKKPVISLHLCQDRRDSGNRHDYMILDENTSEPLRSNVLTARGRGLNTSKSFNETCTQTLTTSAISPNELNTIGVGSSSMIDLESDTLLLPKLMS